MGKPGVRLTDMTAHGGTIIGPGVPTVMTGKMPAATILDQHVCPMVTGVVPHVGGPATLASTGVFIGKKPAGRVGDLHVCVGPPSMPVMGCFTVLIGEAGGGGGGGAGAAAAAASANISSPASVSPFPAAKPPESTELHYCQFKFVDSAGKGLGGIPYVFTGPDKAERTGCSAPEGEILYSGLAKGGSFKVKAGAVTDAKWSKAKAALDDELEMTAKADGLADGTPAILSVLERSNTGQQRFLHKAECKVEGKQIKAKWKVDLGSDDTPSPKDDPQRAEYTYQFIAYAAGGVAVSDKLLIESDLEIEVLDEVAQPITDKPVEVLLKNGEVKTGKLDANGKFKVGKVPAKPASVRLKVPSVFRGRLDGFLFPTAKSFLLPAALSQLEEIKRNYFNHPGLQILIVGHTDRVGDDAKNMTLSKDRAASVKAYLLDEVKTWAAYYGTATTIDLRWGILEDKYMLSAVKDGGKPFYSGPFSRKNDKSYQAALKQFQISSNARGIKLPLDGKADGATREELIKQYMALDGASLPPEIAIQTHGCGEFHNAFPTADGVPEDKNRRVDIFMFEGPIDPVPANCSAPKGCSEYHKWGRKATHLINPAPIFNSKGRLRSDVFQAFNDCFHALDTDKDGFVSLKELNSAVMDPQFKGEHGAMVAAMKLNYGKIEDLSDDEVAFETNGISLADMEELDEIFSKSAFTKSEAEVFSAVQGQYLNGRNKINSANRSVFSGALDPHKATQDKLNDCVFHATLVAFASQRPGDLKSMIKDLGGGKYEVKFIGRTDKVEVSTPTDAEIAFYGTGSSNGMWPTLIEKAFGTAINKDAYFFDDPTPGDAADSGSIFIDKWIKLFTGHDADTDSLYATELATTRKKLISAFSRGKIVTAGIRKQLNAANLTSNNLPGGHAYSVLGYDSLKDLITVRNPWGDNGTGGMANIDGVFSILLKEFDENFSDIAYEE